MGFVFLILYLTLSFVQPVLFFPALAPYRVVLWIGIAGLIASVPHVVSSHVIFRSVQLYAVIGFVGAVCMSVIVGEHWFHGAFWAFGDICTCLVPLVLVLLNVRTCGRVRFIAGLFIALILFLLTCAVVSYHTGYRADLFQVRPGEISGDFEEDVGLVRIRGLGIMSDPNDFGVGLVVAMALCGMFWKRGGVLGNAILIVPCQLFLVYGAYLTRSRGTFIAIVVLVLFVTRRWFGNAASVLATGLAVLGFLRMDFTSGRILSATDESAMGRLNAWSAGLTELRTHPVFGVGYRNFTAYNDLTAHNSFVLCFTELGLLGYFFWLAILAVTVAELNSLIPPRSVQVADVDPVPRQAVALRNALIGFMVTGFFLSRTYIETLYLLIGLAVALVGIVRTAGKPVYTPTTVALIPRIAALEVFSVGFIYVFLRVNRLLTR